MKDTTIFNPFLMVIHLACIFVLAYTLIIKSIFSSTDTLNTHLKQAGLYEDISALAKSEISVRLADRYAERIVFRALADKLLDAIVTPEFVEQRSQRSLTAATKIISQPLDIENNKVVIATKEYKERITKELENRQLPEVIEPTVQNLITSVPDPLTLVDMQKRPNSILGFITKAKIFYENVIFWNSVAFTLGIISALLLAVFNRKSVPRFFKLLSITYCIAGTIVFIGSFLFPYLITIFNQGPNIYLNNAVSDLFYYFFEMTRKSSFILLLLGACFFMGSYLSQTTQFQMLLKKSSPVQKKKNKSS